MVAGRGGGRRRFQLAEAEIGEEGAEDEKPRDGSSWSELGESSTSTQWME